MANTTIRSRRKLARDASTLPAVIGLAALVSPLGCGKTEFRPEPMVAPTAQVVYVVVTPTREPDHMDPVLAAALTAIPHPSPSPSLVESLPTFAGSGHQASNLFSLDAGLYVFLLEHAGDRNFIVHLLDEQGRSVETLANEIGRFSGSKAVRIQHAGKYLLNIDADGGWTASVSHPGLTSSPGAPTDPLRRPTAQQYSAPVVAARPTAEQPFCVIQDFVTKEPDSAGDVWFDGDVENLGAGPAKVVILVKAYSINQRLLDSKTTYPNPHPIPSGQRAHFHSFVKANGDDIRKVIPEVLAQ